MNKKDLLNEELEKNKIDKDVCEAELEKHKTIFATNLLKQYNALGGKDFNKTYIVKKKKSAKWKEFIIKVKKVFGLISSQDEWN